MEENMLESFVKMIKEQSGYSKFIKRDVIDRIISVFDVPCEKMDYPQTIDDCTSVALDFYKYYNYDYYKIIINGLKNKSIIIDSGLKSSYVDAEHNVAYLKLEGNDSDLYMIVHELAHYIDRKATPYITPNEYNFLCEVFSFYMEKQLEKYLLLQNQNYKDLINIRNNNRIFFERKYLIIIKKQLYYEDLYKKQGIISEEQIDIKDAKMLLKNGKLNVVNFLIRYPLANILSTYLIDNNILKEDNDMCEECLKLDLRVVLDTYNSEEAKKRIHKL